MNGFSAAASEEDGEAYPENEDLRHGFQEAYDLELEEETFYYWGDSRPLNQVYLPLPTIPAHWRNKDRPKTTAAALVVCIRLGIEPPDIVKTNPCATLEAWVETAVVDKEKAIHEVGANLEKQYSSLVASKLKYRQYLDMRVEETKKMAQTLRKVAKHERGLLHYNGHGVPKPTPSGEIWVFNKEYTQYIPVALSDLLGWIGSPSILVWECSAAGNILAKVEETVAKKDAELKAKAAVDPSLADHPLMDIIQLGACTSSQTLPQNPDLPADLFTSCLTSPIEMALRFFILRNPLKADLDVELAFKIPGKLSERKSPLGELSWIFTAITDTIAWNTLPTPVFQRLFRHDLVVAALFRGFLLAERIMRHYDCTPVSVPALPPTHNHPMWDSWDLAVDRCLSQLPAILAQEKLRADAAERGDAVLPPEIPYQFSRFFSDQLQAFEIWLETGPAKTLSLSLDSVTKLPKNLMEPASENGVIRPHKSYPEQLPVVLQVLLSQAHRFRALLSLCHFLDFGPWAVQLSLQIGIFPYVLKLLQAPGVEIKPVLIYIWSRILGVFRSCQEDLLKQVATYQGQTTRPDLPFHYFVKVLQPSPPTRTKPTQTQPQSALPIPNVSEHRAMCSFILSVLCRDFQQGKLACLQPNAPVMEACLVHVEDCDPVLRQWACLCLAQLWDDSSDAKAKALDLAAHERLTEMLVDDLPDVRAAVLYALGTLIGCSGSSIVEKRSTVTLTTALQDKMDVAIGAAQDIELGLAMAVLKMLSDGSPTVRRELVVFLSGIVTQHPANMILAAFQTHEEERLKHQTGSSTISTTAADDRAQIVERTMRADAAGDVNAASDSTFKSIIFSCIYKTLLDLTGDPFPRVAEAACTVVDWVHVLLMESPLGANISVSTAEPVVPKKKEEELKGPKRTGSVAVALSKLTHLSGFGEHPAEAAGSKTSLPSPVENSKPSVRKTVSEEDLRSLKYDKSTVDAAIAQLEDFTRRNYSHSTKSSAANTPKLPSTPFTPPNELNTLITDEAMPLRSDFYDYSCKYFREPQFRTAELAEPGSELYNNRLWRRERANKTLMQTGALRQTAAKSKWDEQVSAFNMASETRPEAPGSSVAVEQLVFHQFDTTLVGVDNYGRISCYDWKLNKRIARFWNDPISKRSRVTSLKVINETDKSFLLTCSTDGCVRVFRDYDSSKTVALHTAFRALSDFVPSTRQEAGTVAEWQQTRGHLIVGGSTKAMRIWDASRDQLYAELPTRSNSCVTSITSDKLSGNIIVAGFGDGVLRVYDRRHSQREQMVRAYRGQHSGWIQSVKMQTGGMRELMSGSIASEICFWDIRNREPLKAFRAHASSMSVCDLHDHAPVYASGSEQQVVKVWSAANLEDISTSEPLSRFRNGAGHGYLSQRNYRPPGAIPGANLKSLVFHPHQMVFAVGSEDGHINVYRSDAKGNL